MSIVCKTHLWQRVPKNCAPKILKLHNNHHSDNIIEVNQFPEPMNGKIPVKQRYKTFNPKRTNYNIQPFPQYSGKHIQALNWIESNYKVFSMEGNNKYIS